MRGPFFRVKRLPTFFSHPLTLFFCFWASPYCSLCPWIYHFIISRHKVYLNSRYPMLLARHALQWYRLPHIAKSNSKLLVRSLRLRWSQETLPAVEKLVQRYKKRKKAKDVETKFCWSDQSPQGGCHNVLNGPVMDGLVEFQWTCWVLAYQSICKRIVHSFLFRRWLSRPRQIFHIRLQWGFANDMVKVFREHVDGQRIRCFLTSCQHTIDVSGGYVQFLSWSEAIVCGRSIDK